MKTKGEFLAYLQGKDNLYLYGAARTAKRMIAFCKGNGVGIDGIIVTAGDGNPRQLEGIPVRSLEELRAAGPETASLHVVVAMERLQREVLEMLAALEVRFRSVLFLSRKLHNIIREWEVEESYNTRQDAYRLVLNYPQRSIWHAKIFDKVSKQPLFRISLDIFPNVIPELLEFCTWPSCTEEYGELRYLPHGEQMGVSGEAMRGGKVEIYVATSHLDDTRAEEVNMGGYLSLQVGAALTSVRKGCLTDDTGTHISWKNEDYSECTGLYWIWKNTGGQDYVGLCHYRRKIMIDDDSMDYLRKESVDAVMTLPQYVKASVREFFVKGYIGEFEWELFKRRVCSYDDALPPIFEKYENGHFFFPCNICLMKREWFDRYCEFAFAVAGQVEAFYRERGIVKRDRYMGYLFENMISIFIMWHSREMRTAYTEIKQADF